MQTTVHHFKHKLMTVGLLLALFVIPFATHWQSLVHSDARAMMAGGAVIGSADDKQQPVPESTNVMGQAQLTAGRSFTGVLAR